ncbi:DUF1289 domain-containing protein [Mangrovibrevibacter kandeliae]|uniref:DUF1289 domain-containing protein n=1 Tax=Mangrovibrevibacter kandeliae TaxID=2968473 RepID=UPI002118225E|nr:DUF1289 domain-containing protein [Aurantimonas sp. CSK15Z-1]MCQ8781294.1 DUF1289 domain-containing protein [Aurantimonas sp. CSK15Z-1]
MAKTWRDAPSPCIDVCKYKRQGRCIGCSMTKDEKKAFVRLEEKADKKAFFRMLVSRLEEQGGLAFWATAYRKKCERRDVPCPLDKLEAAEEPAS